MDYNNQVFASVFPIPSLSHTTPTPIATPDLGNTVPGQSFGSPFATNPSGQSRGVKRNLAWSTATRFLSLPKSADSANKSLDAQRQQRTPDVEEALQYLLVGEGRSEDGREDSLVEWFTNEARLHFEDHVRSNLSQLWVKHVKLACARDVLGETQQLLQESQNFYFGPFNDHILPFLVSHSSASGSRPLRPAPGSEQSEAELINARFRRDIQAMFVHALPAHRYSKTLGYVLYDTGCKLFRIYIREDGIAPSAAPEETRVVRNRMVQLLHGLEKVGLGGDNAQKAFAHSINKLIDSFISSHYMKVDWYAKEPKVAHLRAWMRDGVCPFVELVLECLRCESSTVAPTELQQWQEMALDRFGKARVNTLFDFVINWDRSLGAILDIKEYLKLGGAKQYLTSSFSQQISRRLLHAGTPTTYILNVYIYIIRAFYQLEPKGVLLERIARPIRRYLKEREDTASIIISSLLTDLSDETGTKFASTSELSYEIAFEMQKPFANFDQEADEALDWGDMNWQPLPTDASPDYKKSKVEDVIWFLLTLWEREDFINELKNILGDHLLRCEDQEYEKEIRLVELIKIRLGDDKLQACEVMLRDVLDSKRINAAIHATDNSHRPPNPSMPQTPENVGPRTPRSRRPTTSAPSLLPPSAPNLKSPEKPMLNAQILSSFFWPLLREDHFLVPAQIHHLQKEYGSRFESIKGMRKLRWMNALGDGAVALEFEDRTEEFEKLAPWQVSVIHAFQPQQGEEWANGRGKNKANNSSITRNVQQLEDMLEMDEQLVRQAIAFWVGKSVLRETDPDTFAVIEKLTPSNVDTDAAAAAQEMAEVQAQQAGAVRSQADLLAEKKDVYMSCILTMLTNQGNSPVQRILMMIKIVLPGGFPFGVDEMKTLLGEMEKEGKVISLGGDVFGIKR